MDDLRKKLRDAVVEQIPDDAIDMANKLIDAICSALDEGADEDGIIQVINAVVEGELEQAQSILDNAENLIGGNIGTIIWSEDY